MRKDEAMNVIKRDGREVKFDSKKIISAICKAMTACNIEPNIELATKIAHEIENTKVKTVENIQDLVETKLMATKYKDVAKSYIIYRDERARARGNLTDNTIKELLGGDSDYWNNENSNKNAKVVTTQRDYLAGITSTDITRRFLLPKDVVEAHDEGILHFHDADYFAQMAISNCELINLEDMLQNGTMINEVMIEKPHRFITAMTIATQIITAVTSSTYGGATITLTHLAPFVRDSYNKYLEKYKSWGFDNETVKKYAEKDMKKEIKDGVQTFNYQVNSMTNTNGQAPFLSVFMYLNETEEYKKELALLIEEFLNQRIIGFKNENGVYITPAFPKLLYVLEDDNIKEGAKYWYLTELAAKTTAKRMTPDYISEKIMKRDKINKYGVGDVYGCMGCRSFLTPWTTEGNPSKALNYIEGKGKYWGRFNQGVVTLNLPDLALSSNGDINEFWKLFEERTELCHKALRCRHERLSKVTSDVAPILWQHGALARLDKGESIHPLLHGNYSTLSLGYAGLYECVKYMTGESHSHGKGKEFALKLMQSLNDKCSQWKKEEDIGYSLYGSPIESTTYKFAQCLQKRFGKIKDITDHDYITNSYHINVREEIDPFEKLAIEAQYQKLSPGGAISYIETSDMTKNVSAVLEVVKFIYENIMYAELNTKSDYCQKCGYDGEIKIIDKDGKLSWECPNCGNTDQTTMNVARRTCGYIGTQYWNQGRTQEIAERYVHLSDHEE